MPLSQKSLFSRLVNKFREITNQVIDLIVIFIIQTITIPLVILWGLVGIAKYLLKGDCFNHCLMPR